MDPTRNSPFLMAGHRVMSVACVTMAAVITLAGVGRETAVDHPSSRRSLTATPAAPLSEATPATAATPVAEVAVVIERFEFAPRRIDVPVGTTVVWTNHDRSPHTATDLESRHFNSGRLDLGGRYRHTFTEPGAYEYECAYHKDMTGIVVVRE